MSRNGQLPQSCGGRGLTVQQAVGGRHWPLGRSACWWRRELVGGAGGVLAKDAEDVTFGMERPGVDEPSPQVDARLEAGRWR